MISLKIASRGSLLQNSVNLGLLLLILAVEYFMVAMPIWQMFVLPENHSVQLPEFKGSILSFDQMMAVVGSDATKEDWDRISTWPAQEAMCLSYGAADGNIGNYLKMVAIKNAGPGKIQYAMVEFDQPEHWGVFHQIDRIEKTSNTLTLIPVGYKLAPALFIIAGIITGILLVVISKGPQND